MFSMLNLQSLLGLAVIVLACWAMSENRKAFPWRLALGAVAVQAALVVVLFGIPGSQVVLTAITGAVDGLTRASAAGAQFVFGYLAGVFLGGLIYKRLGLAASVFLSLILMAVSNAAYAGLAVIGHDVWALTAVQGFENLASGIGGVTVGAWLALLCDRRFTATQFALLSSAAAILGRAFSSGTAGALIESLGYVNFYWLTTWLAVPGLLIFLWLWRAGLVVADDTAQTATGV
jgi:nucleoside permease NupC